jgi:hypothetical protein
MKHKLSIYLAGGMESSSNLGAQWRTNLTPILEELGLEVLNPVLFEPMQLKGLQPRKLPEFCTNADGKKIKVNHWHDLKHATEPHLYARFLKYMRRIIKYDINIVRNEADYVICYWNETTAKGAGTHAELTEAFLSNKDVYCVMQANMPAWARACCTRIFKTFDDLRGFLAQEFGEE